MSSCAWHCLLSTIQCVCYLWSQLLQLMHTACLQLQSVLLSGATATYMQAVMLLPELCRVAACLHAHWVHHFRSALPALLCLEFWMSMLIVASTPLPPSSPVSQTQMQAAPLPVFMSKVVVDAMQGRCNSDPNQRTVTVMITDFCPECEADHIDIQALTFNKVDLARHPLQHCCTYAL